MEFTKEMQEFFKEKAVKIVLYPTKNIKTFNTIQSFAAFIEKENQAWGQNNSGSRIQEIRQCFQSISNELNSLAKQNNNWRESINRAVSQATRNGPPCVFSCTPEGAFLLEVLSRDHPQQADAAYRYLLLNEFDLGNRDKFIGTLSAYYFKDFGTTCEKSIKGEKESLARLRETYNNEFDSICIKLANDTEAVTEAIKSTHREWTEKHGESERNVNDFFAESKKNMQEMEQLYREKLRLQGPAEYWKALSEKYTTAGEAWRTWSILAGCTLMIFLSLVLYNLPEAFFEKFGFNTVKTTIVFALIASIGVYLIRLFVMLSTSAYHLSRDAYERYQLTHVYLSLLHEKAISESERNIVLQSIFSRADTGLLKGDSSPAFPNVLEQILKNLKK